VVEQAFRLEWANADIRQDQQATQEICERIFEPSATHSKPLVLYVKGTNFQIQVWRALLSVPFGRDYNLPRISSSDGSPNGYESCR
jgi:AraC family transcriptional regulator of adaptative response/methylated-DNA-[protein]-cysteine methyltransferase